ncbi:MAG: hypothetical protein ACXWD5_11740, partial [Mycobacterium sp.]
MVSATTVTTAAGTPHSGALAKSPEMGQTTTRQAIITSATIGRGGGVLPYALPPVAYSTIARVS